MRVPQYEPMTLDEIVGQPAVIRKMQRLAADPQPCCVLFEGRGGTGKSATAAALIHDLGVSELAVTEYAGPNLSIEEVRRLFGHTFRLRPMSGSPWSVLLSCVNCKTARAAIAKADN
jgi:hypothetical protein